MKRYISAAFAAAALLAVSGCEGRQSEPVTEVSTDDTSAGMTSNYTSQSLQAEPVTTAAETSVVSASATSVTHSTTSYNNTAAVQDTQTVSADQSKPAAVRTSATKAPASSKPSSDQSNTETTTAAVITTTTSAEVTQAQEPATRPAPAHDEIISAYKNAISDIIDSMESGDPDTVSVSYTLFDMDGDEIPELIVKCEIDNNYIQDNIYKYDEFGLKAIAAGNLGTNTDFAWDPEVNKFVSAYSYMGEGELIWFGYDGSTVEPLKNVRFDFSSDEPFEVQLEKNGVEMLPFARYTNSFEEVTWVYSVVSGGMAYEEILGRDFSFLDRFEF